MKRHRHVALTMILALALIGLSPTAWSQDLIEFSDVVIFATNSAHLKDKSAIQSGDVVVNDFSNGQTLDGVELSIEKESTLAGGARADSIALNPTASISGTVECNDGSGVTCGGLDLPVFQALPPFQQAVLRPDAADVVVGEDQTASLDAGDFADITTGKRATVVFTGGIYNIGSITAGDSSRLEFLAPTVLRILGRFTTGKEGFLGPGAGSTAAASDIILFVGGTNQVPEDPGSKPAAATLRDKSVVEANVWAANGTVRAEKEVVVTGALLGRDVLLVKKVRVNLASFFADRPPLALSCNAVLDGEEPIVITLEGFDPAGEDLTFGIVDDPLSGDIVSGPTPIVPVATGRCSVSQFVCEDFAGSSDCPVVGDVCELVGLCSVSQTTCAGSSDCPGGETCVQETGPVTQATLVYQPDTPCPPDAEENPLCPEDDFSFDVANESGEFSEPTLCEINQPDPGVPGVINNVQANDDSVDVAESGVVEITLNAGAPDGTTVVFSIEELPAAGTLTLPGGGAVTVGADLASPTVIYTAPGSAGTDGFLFEARDSGDPAGTPCDGADLSDQTDACGQVSIDVQPARELAEDQTVTTSVNEPVEIDLTANAGGTGDPVGGFGAPTKAAAESWTLTGSMGQARAGHLAVRLEDRILVTDGDTAELYDPSEGTFSTTGSPTQDHGSNHTLTRLADGRALLVGGTDAEGLTLGLAEIFDEGTGQWTAVTASLNHPRNRHKTVLLGDGTVLIVGGRQEYAATEFDPICNPGGCNNVATPGSEIFDPADGSFTAAPGGVKFGHEAVRLQDGRVLVTGGEGEGGSWCASPGGECSASGNPCADDSQCNVLEEETCINPGCGSVGTAIFINPLLEVYDPVTQSSTLGTDELYGGTLTLLADGRVLVSGGSSALMYTPDTGAGSLGLLPNSPVESRSNHTASLLQTGEVLLAGGAGATAELFDPSDDTFAATNSMTLARGNHTATLLEDGQVLVTGGSGLASAELYSRLRTDPRFEFEILAISAGTLEDLATGEPVEVLDTFTSETATFALLYTPPTNVTTTQSVQYQVTEFSATGDVVDTATIFVQIDPNDPCVLVGRELGCVPSGEAPMGGGSESIEYVSELSAIDGPSDGLTFIVEGAGAVTSSPVPLADDRILRGLTCTAECTKQFPVGSLVEVFARPDPGYEFVGWSGDCWGDHPIGTARLTRQAVCTATFRETVE